MDITVGAVETYLDSLVPVREPEMQVMEAHANQVGFPIVGPASGQFCYMIARMIGARKVFELGSGYGYSTAWFARAVKENGGGTVHHVVWDAELSRRAQNHLSAMGYDGIIQYRVSEALQALRETEGPFDLVFNDIDKHAYPISLDLITQKVRPGGALIVDNLLWHGRIFDKEDRSRDTQAIRCFTRMVMKSPDWIASLIPIRDGLLVAYRR